MKNVYTVKNIEEIVRCGKTKAYELLHKTQEQFKKEFPNAVLMTNRIPVWYFNERVLGICNEREVKTNEK